MTNQLPEVMIVAAKRTPIGSLLGTLSTLTAPRLAAIAHVAAIEQAQLDKTLIDEVISGCVLQAGIGQAPARQAAIYAGLPVSVAATTINKMCGSGMKAVMLAHDLVKAGQADIILAGGMESMSNAPYLLPKARSGYRLGHEKLVDHLFFDGLEDAYHPGQLMGVFAEATARRYDFSRKMQDEFAKQSMMRALIAQNNDLFASEIAPITLKARKTTITLTQDEGPDLHKIDKIPVLKPVFSHDGTVTAANASAIADGAASLILASQDAVTAHGLVPLARIVAHHTHAQAPEWFTTAPSIAINQVLIKAGWQKADVNLYEINEAFAVVTMAAIKDLALDSEQVNIYGGACALGHPIGASGARILVTLVNALIQTNQKRGVAALCIGGGEATAMAIEMI